MRSFGMSCALMLIVSAASATELSWRNDYAAAYLEAEEAKQLLIVSFYGSDARYEPDASTAAMLQANVPVALATDATIKRDGKTVKVLEAGAFAQLKGAPGVAVINLKYKGDTMGRVVAVLSLREAQKPGKLTHVLEDTARRFGEKVVADPFGLKWYTEYGPAYNKAKAEKKLLFIAIDDGDVRFEPDLDLADALRNLVLLRLHLDESSRLLSEVGMRKFHLAPGIGIVDLKNEGANSGRLTCTIPARLWTKAGAHAMIALADGRKDEIEAVRWHDDYFKARELAEKEHKMLLIAVDSADENYEPREQSIPLLYGYVCLRQPMEATYASRQGIVRRLVDFLDFRPMRSQAGLAVYDFTDEKTPYFGKVVSVMPYKYLGPNPGNRVFSEAEREQELLLLEPETLTRRTLTWAIRVSKGYGENTRLRSADGAPCEARMAGALRNSILQTSYGVGHHAGGITGGEIASPGPGQDIVDGALNMVRIWRGSPPHYGMMVRFHRRFGYDMYPSSSNHWYGTGRF